MALVKARTKLKEDDNLLIFEKIQQRRLQILVHSCIYYAMDTNIVSDMKWQEWANELADLQNKYPEIASTVLYADAFKGFNGATGFDLPYLDEDTVRRAQRLLWLNHKMGDIKSDKQPENKKHKGLFKTSRRTNS